MDIPAQSVKITAIAILTALLLSILFMASNTNKKMLLASVDKSEEMNMSNYGGEYVSYVNTTIDGYKLRALLKEAVNRDIKIVIRFKDEALTTVTHTATFDFRANDFSTTAGENTDKTRSNFFLVDDASRSGVNQMITDFTKEGWYVDPFAKFECQASVKGQVIEALYFDMVKR